MSKPDTMSASEFFKKLEEGNLFAPTILNGMVKPSEDDKDHFLFAPSGDCNNWVKIPKALIAEVRPLGNVSCKDHTHARVEFMLSEPKTAEGRALLSLLGLLSNTIRNQGSSQNQT
jgi:hypothetical protein